MSVFSTIINPLIQLFYMSKGSMWWGNATGKVGQTVLSVLKGQQIARAYQPNVGNPKTEAQMLQRAKFATAVKFYKSAVLGSFKFAFENKNPTESDYNAFMRINKGSNLMINRAAYTNPNYPCVAPWKMSEGTLPHVQVLSTQGDNNVDFYIGAHTGDITSLQDVARALCAANGLPGSTIFTIVYILNGIADVRDYGYDYPSIYSLAQFQDGQTSDTRTLQDLANELGIDEITAGSGQTHLRFVLETGVAAIAIIPTLQTANGLRVGSSQLQLNDDATTFMGNIIETGYIEEALTSWGATGKAILQGALLPAAESGNFITLSQSVIPLATSDEDEVSVTGMSTPIEGGMSAGDTAVALINGTRYVATIVEDGDGDYYFSAPFAQVYLSWVAWNSLHFTNDSNNAVAIQLLSIDVKGVHYEVAQ